TWEGRPVLEFAKGLANRQTGKPNEMSTRFATASISKMFTALCVARLVDAGLCRFDQPLVEIVPTLRPHVDSEVTLAGLLSHTSGLGDYIDDEAERPFAGMDVGRLDSVQAFLPQVLAVPRRAPGTFFYSSAGYILLGLAIEMLTAESFPQAMSRWVTEPAGLRTTGFPSLADPAEDMAIGYLPDGQSNIGHLPIVGGPDGGIVTTAEDLRRLFEALESGGLISESAWQFLGRSVSPIGWQTYGHGFYITPAAGRIWHGHTGSDPGVSARVAFAGGTGSSIVVLCNVESIAFQVFRLIREGLDTGGTALG
ncbi:MAG: serine hydrolase domain-containing protein, partial [Prosthecobacter sp.]|nr:serine hydrolase domain-containing protein [Prosthecobacter sp.]